MIIEALNLQWFFILVILCKLLKVYLKCSVSFRQNLHRIPVRQGLSGRQLVLAANVSFLPDVKCQSSQDVVRILGVQSVHYAGTIFVHNQKSRVRIKTRKTRIGCLQMTQSYFPMSPFILLTFFFFEYWVRIFYICTFYFYGHQANFELYNKTKIKSTCSIFIVFMFFAVIIYTNHRACKEEVAPSRYNIIY